MYFYNLLCRKCININLVLLWLPNELKKITEPEQQILTLCWPHSDLIRLIYQHLSKHIFAELFEDPDNIVEM